MKKLFKGCIFPGIIGGLLALGALAIMYGVIWWIHNRFMQ